MRNLALVWVLAGCLLGCGGGGGGVDSVQSWKSGETVVTLIDSGKTMRVSGWGQMANYGYIGCSEQYFPRPWDSVASTITGLAIEKGVTVIGQLAFSGFTGLTSVTIPNGVFHIGEDAFNGCTSLTTVTIPRSVVYCGLVHWGFLIGSIADVFRSCGGLMSINVNKRNPKFASVDGVLFDKAKKTLLLYPLGRQGAYTIPNGVTKINDYAFMDCRGLTSVTLPNSVTSIEGWVFYGCTGLKSITIPNSVAYIANGAFANSALKSITIPKGVAHIAIGYDVFAGCDSLTSINVDDGNPAYASIDGVLFDKAKVSLLVYPCGRQGAYTIPKGVTAIGDGAFQDCDNLTSINVDDGNPAYASIDGLLFNKAKDSLLVYPCGRQGAYTIPKGVTAIGDGAFQDCDNLTSITIPNSVTTIGDKAFEDCDNLTFITIPNSVTTILDGAFFSCDSLQSITVKNPIPPEIGNYAFYYISPNACLYVPKGSIDAYRDAERWKYNFECIKAIESVPE